MWRRYMFTTEKVEKYSAKTEYDTFWSNPAWKNISWLKNETVLFFT